MKKILLLPSLLVLLLIGYILMRVSTNTSSIPADNQAEEKSATNSIPDNLISCNPAYFERDTNGIAPDCDTFGDEKVCSYHIKEQNGKTKNETIQYGNACSACRFYSETGVRKIGSATFTHLGYIESGCEGVLWK